MFSIYTLSRQQKIILFGMIFFILYQIYILVASFYHSERISTEITSFETKNAEIQREILEKKRLYIKNTIPSTLTLLRKQNLGEIYEGEEVIIIKTIDENKSKIASLEDENIQNANFPQKWIYFITGKSI